MDMYEWAKHEVELACQRENPDRKDGEWDYGCACYESALKAYKSLMEDGHSGMSFGFTKQILIRLMNENPLTPLTGEDDEWNEIDLADNGEKLFQNKRKHSLFKRIHPDGTIEYNDNNRCVCQDDLSDIRYHSGHGKKIFQQYIPPITFPYSPEDKPYVMYTRDFLTDRKNGDFDTVRYIKIMKPDGEEIPIDKFYAEINGEWTEIPTEEGLKRVKMHIDRVKQERQAMEHEQQAEREPV